MTSNPARVSIDLVEGAAEARASVLLEVSDLRTSFFARDGVHQAVRGVSLTIHRREKLAIVGESGCGKSALALSILGLIGNPGRVVGGRVAFNGRELVHLPDREMRKIRGRQISLIYQDPMRALDPVRRIGSQIEEAIRLHYPKVGTGGARARAGALLKEVEIPAPERRVKAFPHELSGGMRQRVMIAIALANNPELIIADEPTTALDTTTQAQVLALLDRLVTQHGAAIMFITHNMGIVAQFCDSVAVMYAGRLVEVGPVGQVFAAPQHPYTKALLRSIPRPDRHEFGLLPTIQGLPPLLTHLPPGCSFEPRCPVGHGRPECLDSSPPLRRTAHQGHVVAVECHFPGMEALGSEADDD